MPVVQELQLKMTEARQSGDHYESMLEKFCKEFSVFCPKIVVVSSPKLIEKKKQIFFSCK